MPFLYRHGPPGTAPRSRATAERLDLNRHVGRHDVLCRARVHDLAGPGDEGGLAGDAARGQELLRVARLVLPSIVPRFLALYPDIQLEIVAEDTFVDVIAAGCDAVTFDHVDIYALS